MIVKWEGEAYINEEQITAEQYKVFFAKDTGKYDFATINTTLVNFYRNGNNEIVPCCLLNKESKHTIENAIAEGHTCGRVYYGAQTLNWAWEPTLTAETAEGPASLMSGDLPSASLRTIAKDMLAKGAPLGIVDCLV